MSNAAFVSALIASIIAVDAAAVAYGVHIGMRYPFIAAAAANTAIVVLTYLAAIIWMLSR